MSKVEVDHSFKYFIDTFDPFIVIVKFGMSEKHGKTVKILKRIVSYEAEMFLMPFYAAGPFELRFSVIDFYTQYISIVLRDLHLEPVCCKMQQKKFLTSYSFVEQGTSEDFD